LKWVFYTKKVDFLASNIIIWTKFLIATPLGPIGLGWPTQIEGGQISWLLPSESPFSIFFWVFLTWMPWNTSTINAYKPWSHVSPKKSKNATLKFFDFFLTFFFLFSKMAVDRVKMIFQTPNKGSTCFKHHKFLNFDEKKYPQNFYTTDFKISLVPCS
jgi:hypothetical protein